MRSLLFSLLFIGCTGFAFCSRNIDKLPVLSVQSGRFFTQVPDFRGQYPLAEIDKDKPVTVQLQVAGTAYLQPAGDLTVQFSGLTGTAKLGVKDRQELHFRNPGGQLVSISLPVQSYSVVGQALQINFALSGATTGRLELLSTQSIVIEDIIVN